MSTPMPLPASARPDAATLQLRTSGCTARLPRVSFIIPVRNDAQRLAGCLASIRRSAYPAECIEVVVADNGSTDGSDEVARQFGAVVVSLPGLSVAEMRNHASRLARGEILAFVDADHEIGAGWLRIAVEDLWRYGVGAAGALCRAPLDGTWVQRTYDRFRARPPGTYEVDWLGSGNVAVWRHAFEEVGGFEVSLQTCEDVDLCRRLRGLGCRILNDDRLRNMHLGDPPTLKLLFLAELWRGRDNLRVSLRGPLAWRELPSIAVPIIDLALMPLAIAGMATVPLGGLTVAAVALGAMLTFVVLRVGRIASRTKAVSITNLGQVLAVATVYDVARALALVARAGHKTRRARPPAVGLPSWQSAHETWTVGKVT